MTPAQLHAAMPYSSMANCEKFAQPITDAAKEFGIDTPQRMAFFLAQIAHESGSLQYVREIASGSAYEGRRDLGNTAPGDGICYKGRGLIQITGRANYAAVGAAFDEMTLLVHPELLEMPVLAARSAGWFWQTRKLNASADENNIRANTRIINGGLNGLADRDRRLAEAKAGIHTWPEDFSDTVAGSESTAGKA